MDLSISQIQDLASTLENNFHCVTKNYSNFSIHSVIRFAVGKLHIVPALEMKF